MSNGDFKRENEERELRQREDQIRRNAEEKHKRERIQDILITERRHKEKLKAISDRQIGHQRTSTNESGKSSGLIKWFIISILIGGAMLVGLQFGGLMKSGESSSPVYEATKPTVTMNLPASSPTANSETGDFQADNNPTSEPGNTSLPVTPPSPQIKFHSQPVVQDVPPEQAGPYPPCSATVTDHCKG